MLTRAVAPLPAYISIEEWECVSFHCYPIEQLTKLPRVGAFENPECVYLMKHEIRGQGSICVGAITPSGDGFATIPSYKKKIGELGHASDLRSAVNAVLEKHLELRDLRRQECRQYRQLLVN